MIWPTCWNIIPSKILILVQASVRWRKTITLSKSIENVMLARSQRVRSKLCSKEAKYTVQILTIYLPTLYSMSLKGLARYAILANNFVAYWLYYKHYSGLCWNTHSLALYKVITRNNFRKYLLLMSKRICLVTLSMAAHSRVHNIQCWDSLVSTLLLRKWFLSCSNNSRVISGSSIMCLICLYWNRLFYRMHSIIEVLCLWKCLMCLWMNGLEK